VGAAAVGEREWLADMLRISMSIEIASIDEVMRVYQGVAIGNSPHNFARPFVACQRANRANIDPIVLSRENT
jgi:hypothetical protein